MPDVMFYRILDKILYGPRLDRMASKKQCTTRVYNIIQEFLGTLRGPIKYTIYYKGVKINTITNTNEIEISDGTIDDYIVTAQIDNISGAKSKSQIYESNPWKKGTIEHPINTNVISTTNLTYKENKLNNLKSQIEYGSTDTQTIQLPEKPNWSNISFYVIDATKTTFKTLMEC